MATQLVKYEQGSGAGVAVGKNVGKLVIGNSFPSTTADSMFAVACDWSGNIFIADSQTNAIYKTTEGGDIGLFAGLPNNDGFVNGTGTDARFNQPLGIACDRSNNVYVADTLNGRVRKIDSNGRVTTIAGGFSSPYDVAVAPNGDVIVCDYGAHKIYRIQPGGRTLLVAGSTAGNVCGYIGTTKVKGSAAKFNGPRGVTVDNSGNIYVADTGNYQIKVIYPDGWVRVFAGSGTQGNVNGVASVARFSVPTRVKASRSGFLYVLDEITTYNRVKRVDPNGNVSTFANPVKNEQCRGIAVSPADKVFVVTGPATAGYESSSSSSSETSANSSQSSQSSASSNTPSSQSSRSSQSSASSASSNTPSSQSSASSATSARSSESSESSSSLSPGAR